MMQQIGKANPPKLTLKMHVRNPDWVAVYTDGRADMTGYMCTMDKECEVVMLNINKGTMRVRYMHMNKVETYDMSADAFFNQYQIVPME